MARGRWSVGWVVLLAGSLLAPVAPLGPAWALGGGGDPGSIGIRLTQAPGDQPDDPRARLYLVDHVHPGTTLTRAVAVSNTTDESRRISVYPGPATITGAQFEAGDVGEETELTRWTRLDKDAVWVPAHGSKRLEVTIDVPDDASRGERYGVVWAAVGAGSTGSVTLVNR